MVIATLTAEESIQPKTIFEWFFNWWCKWGVYTTHIRY